ncbi:hypothetical protein WJX84_007480 [Apatococcus fuscideae]|uniref:Uncharacterized protein n=1 Tax=Apatococcus fuscideae TaxID=2026836 RepID=A0AAW1SMV4_9CHLO
MAATDLHNCPWSEDTKETAWDRIAVGFAAGWRYCCWKKHPNSTTHAAEPDAITDSGSEEQEDPTDIANDSNHDDTNRHSSSSSD